MDRRTFLKGLAATGGVLALQRCGVEGADASPLGGGPGGAPRKGRVALVAADPAGRAEAVARAIALAGPAEWKGQRLFLKPNLNSADPFPGSTHLDTLGALVRALRGGGAARVELGDRSGMGVTRKVMESKGVLRLAAELDVPVHVFDELPAEGWLRRDAPGSHWKQGFALARVALEADGIVQTCCLKTHRFGGHFTLSLKNSVGLAARTVPGDRHDYMQELHGSPDQRKLIAELNTAYRPVVVVMDALEAFTDGGPEAGRKVTPGLVLASTDRVALDAVGVALLRRHGTNATVSRGRVFEQDQLVRAVELGLGARSADEVELVTDPGPAAEEAKRLRELLLA